MTRDVKTYHAWLNNAYGQEICMAKMYAMHANDVSHGLNDFPELKTKLEKQSRVAHSHAKKMKQCVERVTGSPPFIPKAWLGTTMGALLGFTGDVTIDKVIMNNLTDYGMINFEIAAYHTLIAAAKEMDDLETETVCRKILMEEQTFADWMMTQVEPHAIHFLNRTKNK